MSGFVIVRLDPLGGIRILLVAEVIRIQKGTLKARDERLRCKR
jgi:hypothetical protein